MAWSPSDDLPQILLEQNPWQGLGKVPESLAKPLRRPFAECLDHLLISPAFERYQLIIGPRRVGKTVTMYQAVQKLLDNRVESHRLWWLHLAHPVLMAHSLDQLFKAAMQRSGATLKKPAYLFLDEITYAHNWDAWLKTFYDERRPVRIVASSSSTAALRQGRIESGVGRWEEQYLSPCLFTEYLSLRKREPFLAAGNYLADTVASALDRPPLPSWVAQERQRYMFVGGFPELLMKSSEETLFATPLESELFQSQQILWADAIQKSLYLDIPQVFGVGEPLKLERLLYTLAGQIAQIVSFTTLAGNVGLTAPTIEKYVSYFERSFLIFLLPNYAPKEETIQRRGRKLYFIDCAVRNAALQRGIAPLNNAAELGSLFENLAAGHLYALSQQSGVRVYHWRLKDRFEIDLVYDHPDKPMAFEIASSSRHDTGAFQLFQERYPKFAGRCFLVSPDPVAIAPRRTTDGFTVGRLPLDLLLLAVGAQAERALKRRMTGLTG